MPKGFAASALVLCFFSAPAPAAQTSADGPLTTMVKAIQADDYREPCDDKYGPLRLEIAAALDARADAIAAFNRQPLPASGAVEAQPAPEYRAVKLGPTYVMVKSSGFVASKESWVTATNGWADIAKFYAAMKSDPVNENWDGLNGWVRGVLVDDTERVKNGKIFALDETTGGAIEALRPSVEACWKDSACAAIALTAAQRALLASQGYYAQLFSRIEAASNPAERRARIAEFGLRLREDYGTYAFVKSPHVRATGPGQYEVAIDAGPFAEAAEETRAYIESVWRAPGRQVKVVFKSRAEHPDLFSLKLEKGAGGRSFVDYGAKEVVLFPGVRATAIAHEVGHVLGFPDVYFTIWDGEACVYGTRKNKQDLMSDPNSGAVLDAHWQKLAEKYPLAVENSRSGK
ncbi:MAG: hypothetical protein EOP11_20275 [Proteobacteria bacterium]|nr:MAG: hypothetical protein EOP11_20275 [Pseudomonadota bacterium]